MRPSQSSNTTTVLSSGQVSDRPETPDRKVSKGFGDLSVRERRGQETLAEHGSASGGRHRR